MRCTSYLQPQSLRNNKNFFRITSVIIITFFLSQISSAQETHISTEEQTKKIVVSDSLRRQEFKASLLSFLQKIPKDSIRPHTKNRYFQTIITFRVRKENSEAEELLMVESESNFINNSFSAEIQANENLAKYFTTDEALDKIAGPYIFTYLFDNDGSIIIPTAKQIKKEPNLIRISNIVELPLFPGCEEMATTAKLKRTCFQQKMKEHIIENFKYPKEALRAGIEGTNYVYFTIYQTGTMEIHRTKGYFPLLKKEAERIISLLPKNFKPALYKGLAVDMRFTIPVVFKLN